MKLLRIFICLVFVAIPSYSQNKYSTKVKLDVVAPDKIKDEVRSYLSRELRSLGDVTIIEDKPSWSISIIIVPTDTVSGQHLGYAYATLVTQPLHTDYLDKYAKCDADSKEMLRGALETGEIIYRFNVQTSATDELQEISKKLIAEFDSRFLDEERKSWQKTIDRLKGQKP
jgi:hypothetical protein